MRASTPGTTLSSWDKPSKQENKWIPRAACQVEGFRRATARYLHPLQASEAQSVKALEWFLTALKMTTNILLQARPSPCLTVSSSPPGYPRSQAGPGFPPACQGLLSLSHCLDCPHDTAPAPTNSHHPARSSSDITSSGKPCSGHYSAIHSPSLASFRNPHL